MSTVLVSRIKQYTYRESNDLVKEHDRWHVEVEHEVL